MSHDAGAAHPRFVLVGKRMRPERGELFFSGLEEAARYQELHGGDLYERRISLKMFRPDPKPDRDDA